MTTMSEDEEFERHFAALREKFRERLPDYHSDLVRARSGFLGSGEEGVRDIRRVAHTLAGAAGTFGFPEIGEAAVEVETSADAVLSGAEGREAVIGPLRQLIKELELSL
jgi:HPt (histidine-containing phosphotransfer) domain-containing protein